MSRTIDLPPWAADILQALPPILTRAEAAKALRMCERTLDRRIAEGRLVAIKDDGRVTIPRLAVVHLLVANAA